MAAIKNAKKTNFKLKKFVINDGKTSVDYSYKHDENPDSEIRVYPGVKIPLQPHPDLVSLFNQFREYVLKEFYIDPTVENLAQVTVKSITLSGDGDNTGIIISSVFDTLHGGKVALNTSNIILSGEDTGLEAEIDAILDSIIDEVFQYLFKGKRADPTLFGAETESEDRSGLNTPQLSKVG